MRRADAARRVARLAHAFALCGSFEARDGWLSSGMEVGIDEGYRKLDALVAEIR